MNICFIGGGNMAGAMIGGLIKQGMAPNQLRVVEVSGDKRKQLQSLGVLVFAETDDKAIGGSDVVVLAIKPQQMKEVAVQLGPRLSSGQIVLSIAAGIRLTDLARWLGGVASNVLVRAMPNTPALIGGGITGLYSFPPLSALNAAQREQVETQVETIMRACGTFVWLRGEDEMDAVTAISGSGPAYFFYFIEALEQAAKELGLLEHTARKLAVETALGAARLAHESGVEPGLLRAQVTSKNGTTERALLSLEASHVKQHIITAAKAAHARAREMGDELGGA